METGSVAYSQVLSEKISLNTECSTHVHGQRGQNEMICVLAEHDGT